MKRLLILTPLILGLLAALTACSSSVSNSETLTTTPTSTLTSTSNLIEKYDDEWAKAQVIFYLENLAESAEAIRYLADLIDVGWLEARYDDYYVDSEFGGHKDSGWDVYFRPYDRNKLKYEYWGNLNWNVFKDNYVTEGSDDALRVKADLLELNQQ